jgi:hypothetical protein
MYPEFLIDNTTRNIRSSQGTPLTSSSAQERSLYGHRHCRSRRTDGLLRAEHLCTENRWRSLLLGQHKDWFDIGMYSTVVFSLWVPHV